MRFELNTSESLDTSSSENTKISWCCFYFPIWRKLDSNHTPLHHVPFFQHFGRILCSEKLAVPELYFVIEERNVPQQIDKRIFLSTRVNPNSSSVPGNRLLCLILIWCIIEQLYLFMRRMFYFKGGIFSRLVFDFTAFSVFSRLNASL